MSINQHQFKILHDQYRDRLVNSMTAVVRDRDTADDVTSAALATAWQKRNQFRGESQLCTWVYSIALNIARDRTRSNRTVSLDSIEGTPEVLREPDRVCDATEAADARGKLQIALSQIPAIHRRALVDHFVHGRSVKQIARRYRIPVGTVLSRIFSAKRLLRAAWGV